MRVLDESTRHDSSSVLQIIAETLEQVSLICRRRNTSMPTKLLLIGDNCVRELKNTFTAQYLSNLIARRKMRLTGMLFLRKSHTHCKLDQIFGVLSRRVACTDSILDADSTCDVLRAELSRPGFRAWLGATTELNVSKLNAAFNWRDHFAPQGASVSGGLLLDSTANHCFLFMQQKGRGNKVFPRLDLCFER